MPDDEKPLSIKEAEQLLDQWESNRAARKVEEAAAQAAGPYDNAGPPPNPMAGQVYREDLTINDKLLLGLANSTPARGGPPRRPAA